MITISVIIPVYNSESRLYDCLESILNQSFKDFEVICINDNSNDNSLEILNIYKSNYTNFEVINLHKNQGAGFCRNEGIKIAKGEYLSFVDSDDTISKDFLKELYLNATNTNSQISVCNFYSNKKCKIKKRLLKNFDDKLKFFKNGSCCNKLFKKDFIVENKIEFGNGILFEDNLFLIKALFYSKNLITTNKATYFYFSNPNSTTRSNKINASKKMRSTIVLLNELFNFARNNHFNKKQINLLKEFCLRSFINGAFLNNNFFMANLPKELKNDKNFAKEKNKAQYSSILEKIFSFKNSKDKKYKIITFLGLAFKMEKQNAK